MRAKIFPLTVFIIFLTVFSGCRPSDPADGQPCAAVFSIDCGTILRNLEKFDKNKLALLPEDGIILSAREVIFDSGDSVFDILKRETAAAKIHLEFTGFSVYNSIYIEGINNIYEYDCGELSGWTYMVNGLFPNTGCGNYYPDDGDVIEWVYTCDLGRDIGYSIGGD